MVASGNQVGNVLNIASLMCCIRSPRKWIPWEEGGRRILKFNLFLLQAKTEAEVLSEKEGLYQERVWLVHKGGFCLGTVMKDSPKKSTALSTHTSFFKVQVGSECRVQSAGWL